MQLAGLYPILDVDTLSARGLSILEVAEQVLTVRPCLLQLRAKSSPARGTLEVLRALRPLCGQTGTLLFANDRPDLAVLAGADGVHVGQDDLPIREVRRFAPGLAVGVSTHSLDQLDAALADQPTYVAFGPIFATPSKRDHEPPVGLDGLRAAASRARAANVPLVAIGGIDVTRAPSVAELGALAAVIGALVPGASESVAERARALHRALDGK